MLHLYSVVSAVHGCHGVGGVGTMQVASAKHTHHMQAGGSHPLAKVLTH
jgi:hypothetical protein